MHMHNIRKFTRIHARSIAVFFVLAALGVFVAHEIAVAYKVNRTLYSMRDQQNALAHAWVEKDLPLLEIYMPTITRTFETLDFYMKQSWIYVVGRKTYFISEGGSFALKGLIEHSREMEAYFVNTEQPRFSELERLVTMGNPDMRTVFSGVFPAELGTFFAWYGDQGILSFGNPMEKSSSFWAPVYGNMSPVDGVALAKWFLTGEEKYFLVLLANNDELRSTGGFYGSFAIVRIANGSVDVEFFDDIYNLDNPAEQSGYEPETDTAWSEMFEKKHQFLRDQNWDTRVDIELANAQKKFMEEWNIVYPDTELELDGTALVTPDAVRRIMEITGPVTVDDHKFTPDQFAHILQYKVQQEFWRVGKTEADRKEVVGLLGYALIDELKTLSGSEMYTIYGAVQHALAEKEIVISSSAEPLASVSKKYGWDGSRAELETDGVFDYLAVYDVNVTSQKTDAVMDKRAVYTVTAEPNERTKTVDLKSELQLFYRHTSLVYSWRISPYRSRTRVIVPDDVRITNVYAGSGAHMESISYTSVRADGYAAIAFDVALEKGEARTYGIEYVRTVPAKTTEYTFIFQKQPGRTYGMIEKGVYPEIVKEHASTEAPLIFQWKSDSGSVHATHTGNIDVYADLTLTENGMWKIK